MKMKKNDLHWTAITYPQDFCDSGASLGPQTILRLQRIVDCQKDGEYKITNIVLACGIGPDTYEYPYQTKSFAVMMREWLISEGTFSPDIIHCSKDDNVWNCIQVTMEMVSMVKKLHLPKNILVVSTGGHVYPRMWITWSLLFFGSGRWNLSFVPVWNGTYKLIHELLGTVKYIPMALFYRLVGRV